MEQENRDGGEHPEGSVPRGQHLGNQGARARQQHSGAVGQMFRGVRKVGVRKGGRTASTWRGPPCAASAWVTKTPARGRAVQW